MPNLGSVGRSCDTTAEHLTRILEAKGFRVMRSFDLQTARRGLRVPGDCPCPSHGTARCTCQYIVLLVSQQGGTPSTITIHGHGDRTYLSIPPQEGGDHFDKIERAVSAAMMELNQAWLATS